VFMTISNFTVNAFHPFRNLNIQISEDYGCESLIAQISNRNPTLGALLEDGDIYLCKLSAQGCSLSPRLLGGKGGFGSQLRAAGGRMSSQRTGNNDSCRDLNGRRLSTVKEAKRLADYIEGEDQRKKAVSEARKQKLEKLERRIQAAEVNEDEPSGSGQKRRLEDTEYVEQSKELVEGVRNAVAAGLLRKKKKAKTDTQQAAEKAATSSVPVSASEAPSTVTVKTAQAVAAASA